VIIRKEWVDIVTVFFSFNKLMAGGVSTALFCAAAGIYEPAKMGLEWLRSPIMAFFLALLIPLSLIAFISPDSFTGERRRKTLEPLLATPISDLALLFGKIGISTLFGFALVVLNMVIGLLTVNFSSKLEVFSFYSPDVAIGVIVLGFLIAFLFSILGTYSSLYSHTLVEAQNKMGLLLFLPLLLVASFVSPYTPDWWKMPVIGLASSFGMVNLYLSIAILLLITNFGLSVWVMMRFHRKQLIL
jgi:ABC-2 type transport system permease protein